MNYSKDDAGSVEIKNSGARLMQNIKKVRVPPNALLQMYVSGNLKPEVDAIEQIFPSEKIYGGATAQTKREGGYVSLWVDKWQTGVFFSTFDTTKKSGDGLDVVTENKIFVETGIFIDQPKKLETENDEEINAARVSWFTSEGERHQMLVDTSDLSDPARSDFLKTIMMDHSILEPFRKEFLVAVQDAIAYVVGRTKRVAPATIQKVTQKQGWRNGFEQYVQQGFSHNVSLAGIGHSGSAVWERTGSCEEQWAALTNIFCSNPKALFVAGFAMAGPLVSMTGKENPILEIIGETSRGKTTLLEFIQSCSTNPQTLLGFNATAGALDFAGVAANDYTLLVDEISQLKGKSLNFLESMIFNFADTIKRSRLSKKNNRYVQAEPQTKHQSVILTGNESIKNLSSKASGKEARVITLRLTESTQLWDDSEVQSVGDALEEVSRVVQNNYGHVAPWFISFYSVHGFETIQAHFYALKKLLGSVITNENPGVANRQRTTIALMMLGYEAWVFLAEHILGYEKGWSESALQTLDTTLVVLLHEMFKTSNAAQANEHTLFFKAVSQNLRDDVVVTQLNGRPLSKSALGIYRPSAILENGDLASKINCPHILIPKNNWEAYCKALDVDPGLFKESAQAHGTITSTSAAEISPTQRGMLCVLSGKRRFTYSLAYLGSEKIYCHVLLLPEIDEEPTEKNAVSDEAFSILEKRPILSRINVPAPSAPLGDAKATETFADFAKVIRDFQKANTFSEEEQAVRRKPVAANSDDDDTPPPTSTPPPTKKEAPVAEKNASTPVSPQPSVKSPFEAINPASRPASPAAASVKPFVPPILHPTAPQALLEVAEIAEIDDAQNLAVLLDAARARMKVEVITTPEQLNALAAHLMASPLACVDTETTGLDIRNFELVGISVCTEVGSAAYIPIGHVDEVGKLREGQLAIDFVLAALKPWLENEAAKKLGHNLKFDALVFQKYAIKLLGVAYDTALEAYCLGDYNALSLEALVKQHLGFSSISINTLITNAELDRTGFSTVPIEEGAVYACEDVELCLRLHEKIYPLLSADEKLKALYEKIEFPLLDIVKDMEAAGIMIDLVKIAEIGAGLEERMDQAEAEVFKEKQLNINSNPELEKFLFDDLKLPVIKRTEKGARSVGDDVLEALEGKHQVISPIRIYKKARTINNTFAKKYPTITDAHNRIHAAFNQCGARTGRFSSHAPNLQNVPSRGEDGKNMRTAFIAAPNHKFVIADYSQMELRVLAHAAQDTELLRLLREKIDVHKQTAANIFNVEFDDVTEEQRSTAKTLNFGLMYGQSALGFARAVGISEAQANMYIQKYFARFPQIKKYMAGLREQVQNQKYVETIFGRRVYADKFRTQGGQERAAMNAPIQGSAADIAKIAMRRVYDSLQEKNMKAKLLLQIHDEFLIEAPDAEVEQVKEVLRDCLENAAQLSVPLDVKISVGQNWAAK